LGQGIAVHHQPISVETEHDVEARDLLLDERPLVYPARAFEEQRLRIDRYAFSAILGLDVGLEIESAARPGEQRVDGVFRVQRPVYDRGVTDSSAVEVDRAEAVME